MDGTQLWAAQVTQSSDWESIIRLLLATFLGGLIGAEREYSGHPAGLRTNILVAVGSCLFTILSIKAFPLSGTAQDTARVAAQVVTGVGFLALVLSFKPKGLFMVSQRPLRFGWWRQ